MSPNTVQLALPLVHLFDVVSVQMLVTNIIGYHVFELVVQSCIVVLVLSTSTSILEDIYIYTDIYTIKRVQVAKVDKKYTDLSQITKD